MVQQRHKAVVKLLVATDGVGKNSKDNNGWTPLMITEDEREDLAKLRQGQCYYVNSPGNMPRRREQLVSTELLL